MALIALAYFTGFWLTFVALLWAAFQPSGRIGAWPALVASLVWFVTLPLAVMVIARLRRMLPYAVSYVRTRAIPMDARVKVKLYPTTQMMEDLGLFLTRAEVR